jgi:hypothetical protein
MGRAIARVAFSRWPSESANSSVRHVQFNQVASLAVEARDIEHAQEIRDQLTAKDFRQI